MSGAVHVVVGAGQVGSLLAAELHDRGHAVRSVSRSGTTPLREGIEVVRDDILRPGAARGAVEGAAVVYFCVNAPYDRWAEDFPRMQRAVLDAAAAEGAKVVALQNMYGYGPVGGAPLREDTPMRAGAGKGLVRRRMAEEIDEAHRDGRVRTTALRAADYVGPGVGYGPAADMFDAAVHGRTVHVPFDADLPHTVSYLPDVARGLAVLGATDKADGRAWHVPNPPARTLRELLEGAGDAAGRPVDLEVIPEAVLERMALADPAVAEMWEIRHFMTEPYLVDHSAFAAAFGDIATGWDEALPATVDWYSRHRVR